MLRKITNLTGKKEGIKITFGGRVRKMFIINS